MGRFHQAMAQRTVGRDRTERPAGPRPLVRFVNDDREATYSQVVTDESIVSRVVVNQSGLIQHSLWSREAGQWNISWYAPTSGKCDAVGLCGAYGVCNADDSPALCQCLPGFVPSNQRKWDSWNWAAGGCVRRTNLTCTSNGTTTEDGFATVGSVKLPMSSNAVVDMSLSLEECEAKCLENCSCTAYASANISSVDGKKGCVMWADELLDISKVSSSGQDLHVRLSAADLASRNGRSIWSRISWPLALTAMYVGGVSFTIYLTCVIRRYWSGRKRRRRELQYANSFRNEQSDEGANYFDLPIMDFATIEAATENFSSTNKLGQGGYGPVYKGILGDSREIAVKRLAKTSLQGSEEFKNEVILIAKLQNRNLVQLLGCCIERKERMLIYEYMVNKSLDSFLFEKQISPFDWQTRYRIILGITRGLLYLHHDSRLRIIHRDLKASNILLDKDMNPKISDFGMARILAGDETNINTKKVVGTYGYMSPEYALDGIFSLKSDVYSFGVLVLEIISGKKNRGSSPFSPQLNLVSHAWSLWIERKALELVDESMNYTVAVNEVLNCIKVGLLCVQECPEDRPLMSSVILMLGSDIATLPEPKQPGFVTRLSPPEVDEPVDKHILYVSNNLTSSLTGR
ncbi:receptor-like serine/threonine-protein kinase SD1-8 [Iris pallida]|uniref:non-specific serine/threonine protein kinase n=1 Tax=Iris pallida TaxID=29817 RepID=A0AAX6HTP2_IRIPA|nr:receptor-like serine/threonine-protein kinase SD1-8 [Iris pallida]